MEFRGERALAVVGAAAVLVLGFDGITYAATGSSLILGHANTASGVTTIQNTGNGPALSLLTKATTSAPFSTNATGRVGNLYATRAYGADRLGGQTLPQVLAGATPTLYKSYAAGSVQTDPAGPKKIVSVTVPRGSYALTAKLYWYKPSSPVGPGPYDVLCSLSAGGIQVDFENSQKLATDNTAATLPLVGSVTVTKPTLLSVDCLGNGETMDIWAAKLNALRVGTIH
jgi:hypothetical protein